MAFQSDPKSIVWKIHLRAAPEAVYDLLSTNDGRSLFWAESAMELDKQINFIFPNGEKWYGKVIEARPGVVYRVQYVGNTTATLKLEPDGEKGTILTLTDDGVAAEKREETIASWVSILLALKAAAEFDVDLRNHDTRYTWENGFVDN